MKLRYKFMATIMGAGIMVNQLVDIVSDRNLASEFIRGTGETICKENKGCRVHGGIINYNIPNQTAAGLAIQTVKMENAKTPEENAASGWRDWLPGNAVKRQVYTTAADSTGGVIVRTVNDASFALTDMIYGDENYKPNTPSP